jgi:hypothetical protein
MFFYFIAFNGTGSLYGAAKKKEFFCKGSFTGIGVAYDGKGFTPVDFAAVTHIFILKRAPVVLPVDTKRFIFLSGKGKG